MSDPPLVLENVSIRFGGVFPVREVSLELAVGERHVLIGPNGAGKSTLFNLIGGQLRPSRGSVRLWGRDVTNWSPERRVRLGLARTFQITNLFGALTVDENVRLAILASTRRRWSFWRGMDGPPNVSERLSDLLAEWGMAAFVDRPACELGYGEQRLLEIVVALAARPSLVILDEPTAGLAVSETSMITDAISALGRDVTLLVIEHDMSVAFALADRVTLLAQGAVVTSGTVDEIQRDPRANEIYLGRVLGAA